ncbi:MAG: Radical SAM superfamily protein [Syntrophorhabdus sp. PtaB.Bin047]|jgi:DNA repair photolyase|nr:MAG: Radical SAM superfamily protein [Syntrophorhabdus sp. PtaB.Bin047]
MNIREITARNALARTGIEGYDYCLNPYVGCGHGCRYCYATFMKRFTGHTEPWGDFVDVKANVADVLRRQLRRIRGGTLLIGTVTDPYQPLEKRYCLTRDCLTALVPSSLEVHILTRSPLVVRDTDILTRLSRVEVGLSITTNREDVKQIFEPRAPSIASRVEALKALHDAGLRTYVFVGPLLPMDPAPLASMIEGAADEVLIDRLNYAGKVAGLLRSSGLAPLMATPHVKAAARELHDILTEKGIPVSVLFP